MIRIGINGFGRIGRIAFRSIIRRKNIAIVAINDVLEIEHLAYLLRYDSVHGRFDGEIEIKGTKLIVNNQEIEITNFKTPSEINWSRFNIDYVIESTGLYTAKELASQHIKSGAKKVVISAPSNSAPMFVMGVNHHLLQKNDLIFSNASCTTNCLAPILKVLDENYKIEEAFVTTVHSTTSSQKTVDGPAEKWRRGRAALNNMIPTSTSASEATIKVLPHLKGKVKAMAVRVPIVDASLIDVTVRLAKSTTYQHIKNSMLRASQTNLKGVLGYTEDEVVSQDFVSETHTSVFDANAGMELNNHFFKIIAWYDNEYGYATKLVDLIEYSSSL